MNDKHKKANSEVLAFTGERFVPEVHGNIELEHLHRYLQACEIAVGKVVLDIASGEGYGSAMLARRAGKVIGVDISVDAVKHAHKRYKKENLDYMAGSCADIPLPDASIDLIVSFETIEHHDQHEKMMQEFKRVLRSNGVLLISSPDKYQYSVEPGLCNPYHIKELYQHEFKQLLGNYFKNVNYFGQRLIFGSGIFAESLPTPALSYLQENEKVTEASGIIKPVYWIALASDIQLPKLASGVLEQPINDSEIIQSWAKVVAERDGQVARLNQAPAEREEQVATLNNAIAERYGEIASLNQAIAERYGEIANLNQAVTVRDERIADLTQMVVERDGRIGPLNQSLTDRESRIVRLSQEVGQLEAERQRFAEQVEHLQATTRAQEQALNAVRNTIGWKALERYRKLREKSKVLKFSHFLLTGPIKRVSKNKK